MVSTVTISAVADRGKLPSAGARLQLVRAAEHGNSAYLLRKMKPTMMRY